MKPDILTRNDIEELVHVFYERVKTDDTIGFFFTEVVPVNWEEHSLQMCAFWENILFFTGDYEGDPLTTHRSISQKHPTTAVHFKRWMDIFTQTVDELFEGENATKMKSHAKGIAAVMQEKIEGKK